MVLTPNQPLKIDLPTKRDRLIVMPKWQTVPDPKRQGWELGMGLLPPQQVVAILPKIPGLTVLRRQGTEAASLQSTKIGPFPGPPRVIGAITQLQTISAPQLQPMVLDAHGGVVLARTGEATFVLSDPDLLNELGMKDPATARFTFELLKADTDEKPVSFDVTLNGIAQGRSLLRTAIEPPFLGATLCLLLAAALVGWQGWNRFGPPQPSQRAVALGKAALVDNGAGMIRMARREAAMARRYVRLSRERVAAALGAEHLDPPALEDFLDRWAERVGAKDRISALAAEAVTIKTSAAVAPLARRARLWQAEMTRATR